MIESLSNYDEQQQQGHEKAGTFRDVINKVNFMNRMVLVLNLEHSLSS